MDLNSDFPAYCRAECRSLETALDSSKSQDDFLAIHKRITFIEARLNERASSLPSYTLKQLQATLSGVKHRSDQAHAALMPKTKFSFGKHAEKRKVEVGEAGSKKQSAVNTNSEALTSSTADVSVEKAKQIIANVESDSRTFRIENRLNETICKFANDKELDGGNPDVNDMDKCRVLELSNLENCKVLIEFTTSTIHCDGLRNCVVVCAPSRGSVFVDSCSNCVFAVAAQQLRIHRTTSTRFITHISAGSIIEDCNAMEFASWSKSIYSHFGDALKKIMENEQPSSNAELVNNWRNVDDFNHLDRHSASPNWTTLDQIADADLQAIDALCNLRSTSSPQN